MEKAQIDYLQSEILNSLYSIYSADNGKTTFQGQSVSFVITSLRDNGIRIHGNNYDIQNLIEELGFTVIRARPQRIYRGGKLGYSAECNCVTL